MPLSALAILITLLHTEGQINIILLYHTLLVEKCFVFIGLQCRLSD